MLAFIIIGGVGLGLLLVSLLIGELFEAFNALDFGSDTGLPVSSSAVFAGLTGFGGIGTLCMANHLSWWLAVLVALAAAVLLAAAVQWLINRLAGSDSGDVSYSVVGSLGIITSATGPAAGEVRLDDPRDVETRLAWSDDQLPVGTRVRVTQQAGPRVHVEPADEKAPEQP